MIGRRARSAFQHFIESEASGGLLLMASAVIGMLVANSALLPAYNDILRAKFGGLYPSLDQRWAHGAVLSSGWARDQAG